MIYRLRPPRHLTVAVISLVLLLPGCAKLLTEPPRPLYRIGAPTDFPATLPRVPVQIVVATPYASGALDSQRIALSRSPVSLDYLADGDWIDRAPNMLQTVLIEAFENSRTVAGVGPQSLSLRADYVIESDLRHFEVAYDLPSGDSGPGDSHAAGAEGRPVAWVALAVKLVKVPEHKILAQTVVSAREAAAVNATPQIAVAFNTAAASVARQVVSWAVTSPALSPASK
jgi:cholesterol transport system auxiliary component